MNSSPKKKIIEALKDQKEIFGDDLMPLSKLLILLPHY